MPYITFSQFNIIILFLAQQESGRICKTNQTLTGTEKSDLAGYTLHFCDDITGLSLSSFQLFFETKIQNVFFASF